MNHSIYTADKATHLKVVVTRLATGIAIMTTALTVHLTHSEFNAQTPRTIAIDRPHPGHGLTKVAQR
ncbi:hypothetical protein ACFQZO_10560 [Bradyrhizobium sp. GCM10027634]|uniref:hypothetical protein n=1 Tax=unclassified Bradyrhizobium TaxID=2631580 RepID=UPI00263AC7CF|nr:hypothetical protein [Bradyrhizobium sp. WYCCWR 12677]MDN5001325.1 hypothetical protein [Bradyrhizobium sp. WYCCWR 12677]